MVDNSYYFSIVKISLELMTFRQVVASSKLNIYLTDRYRGECC